MSRRVNFLGLLFVGLALAGQAGAAEPLPRPDGWVTDEAGFLTAREEQALETLMESYKLGSDNEIALVTVPNLGGRSLEQYALEVGRAWGIGEEGRNNGALLLVAKAERSIRIEVGRGLEGNLTDSISGRIIRDVIGPEFKRGRFYDGLRSGVEAMHAAAGGDYGKIPNRGGKGRSSGGICALPGVFWVLFMLFIITRGRRGPRGRGRGGSGILPWLLLGAMTSGRGGSSGWGGGSSGGGGFGGFGGGGGFSGGGASGGW